MPGHDIKEERRIGTLCRSRLGFTLIELMIVVAIIAIIAAIAIPNLMRSRQSANEANALSSMRTIATAEAAFQAAAISMDPTGLGWFGTLGQLGGQAPPFIDQVLAGGTKQGYLFFVTLNGQAPGVSAYQATAISLAGTPNVRSFYSDESGVLRFTSDGTPPGPGSPMVQ